MRLLGSLFKHGNVPKTEEATTAATATVSNELEHVTDGSDFPTSTIYNDGDIRDDRKLLHDNHGIFISDHTTNTKGRSLEVVHQYVEDTELMEYLSDLFERFLKLENIPENPYPGFIRRLRRIGENPKFLLWRKSEVEILNILENEVVPADEETCITHVDGNLCIWGLKNVLAAVDVISIVALQSFIDEQSQNHLLAKQRGRCSCEVLTSLVGSFVYYNGFFEHPGALRLRQDIIVDGPDEIQSLNTFCETVLQDVLTFEKKKMHIFLGFRLTSSYSKPRNVTQDEGYIETTKGISSKKKGVTKDVQWKKTSRMPASKRDGESGVDVWSMNRIEEDRAGFLDAMRTAVSNHRLLIAKVVYNVKLQTLRGVARVVYQPGEKQYIFHYRQAIVSEDGNILSEGKAASVSYSAHPYETLYEGVFFSKESAMAYARLFLRPGKPRPLDSSATDSWRRALKSFISTLNSSDNMKVICHQMFKILRFESHPHYNDIILEIYRFLHSTAAQISGLIEQNHLMVDMVAEYRERGLFADVAQHEFWEYCQQIINLLSLQCSSHFLSVIDIFKEKLDRLRDPTPGSRLLYLHSTTLEQLQSINEYCNYLYISIAEDTIYWCDHIKRLHKNWIEEFQIISATVPETVLNLGGDNNAGKGFFGLFKGKKLQKHEVAQQDEFTNITHGAEIPFRFRVLNFSEATDCVQAPPAIAKEGVLLQFIVDTRLDQVFNDILLDLLSVPVLLSNPYPFIVNELTKAMYKHDLWKEEDGSIINRIVNIETTTPIIDTDTYVCELVGHSVFGYRSALSLVDGVVFLRLIENLLELPNKVVIEQQGQTYCDVSIALSGLCTMYGALFPYIHELDVQEDYYLRGPHFDSALHLFAKNIYDHIYDLHNRHYLISAIFLADRSSKWTIWEMIEHKSVFLSEFNQCVRSNKGPIWMQAQFLVEWRYITVNKYFVMHLRDTHGHSDSFLRRHRHTLHQNVFLGEAAASDHHEWSQIGEDPMLSSQRASTLQHIRNIINNELMEGNILEAYRWMALHCKVKQDFSRIPDIWRMFHSVSEICAYLKSINVTLQCIIEDELYLRDMKRDNLELTSRLDVNMLRRMLVVYKVKVVETLRHPLCVTANFFPKMISEKLQKLLDAGGDNETLKISSEAVKTLKEVCEMITCMGSSIAVTIHQLFPEMQSTFKAFSAESRPRSRRVLSSNSFVQSSLSSLLNDMPVAEQNELFTT